MKKCKVHFLHNKKFNRKIINCNQLNASFAIKSIMKLRPKGKKNVINYLIFCKCHVNLKNIFFLFFLLFFDLVFKVKFQVPNTFLCKSERIER